MIAKAKAISHGINAIRYIIGESQNKSTRRKFIGYWTICCHRNRTLWGYGTPCN